MLYVKDLEDQTGEITPRPVLYCDNCEFEFSAHKGDYFQQGPEEALTCGVCETPLKLVVMVTTVKVLKE